MTHAYGILFSMHIKYLWTQLLPLIIFSFIFANSAKSTTSQTLNIAVASNFSHTIDQIKPLFEEYAKVLLTISKASSGKLYAQILNGAPYDVFLSADSEKPKRLIQKKLADSATQIIYATGKLLLWVPNKNIGKLDVALLIDPSIKKIAIANSKLTPYGLATEEFLTHTNLLKNLKPKFVIGENINQTYNYISTGNAHCGFVALSQLKQSKQDSAPGIWLIPSNLYNPIQQSAVLLKKTLNYKAAKDFLAFLKSSEIKVLIQAAGYEVSS